MDEIRIFKDKVYCNNLNLNQKKYGIIQNGNLVLMPEEFLYLLSRNKINTDKPLTYFIKKFSKKIQDRFVIYEDLRKKGYILKSGLKFGSDFRVYDKNKFDGHSKWLLNVLHKSSINKKDFSSMNRLANSTKKNILLAYLDSENGISYFEISWKKL